MCFQQRRYHHPVYNKFCLMTTCTCTYDTSHHVLLGTVYMYTHKYFKGQEPTEDILHVCARHPCQVQVHLIEPPFITVIMLPLHTHIHTHTRPCSYGHLLFVKFRLLTVVSLTLNVAQYTYTHEYKHVLHNRSKITEWRL